MKEEVAYAFQDRLHDYGNAYYGKTKGAQDIAFRIVDAPFSIISYYPEYPKVTI